jgi:hypothetical protein
MTETVSENINAYIVVSTLIVVMCVRKHSLTRAILDVINTYIVVKALIVVKYVIRVSV